MRYYKNQTWNSDGTLASEQQVPWTKADYFDLIDNQIMSKITDRMWADEVAGDVFAKDQIKLVRAEAEAVRQEMREAGLL